MRVSCRALAFALLGSSAAIGTAQTLAVPALNSNPGARYTVYLNFRGIQYPGTWGFTGKSPGNVPAYTLDGDANNFSTAEINNMKEIWARTSQKYIGFNINVTTVDPAPSGLTDAQRIAWYDSTQYLTHAMIGGSNSWYGSAGGVSYLNVAQQSSTTNGRRTNWTFPAGGSGTSPHTCTAACAHEIGHHLGLPHQKDEATGAEYSTNNGASGNGSYAPLMGVTYSSQRGTWRQGSAFGNINDVATIQQNLNIGPLLDSGNGHTKETATLLPVKSDGTVDATLAKGWIMPKASTGYSAVGESSYTTDFFVFGSTGGMATLNVHDGTQFLTPGVADPGATGRSLLRIYNSSGGLVGSGLEDVTTLKRTWSGNLAAGTYYAQIVSYGDYTSSYEPNAKYFNMGAYFISGSGVVPVPEPATIAALSLGIAALARRCRRAN